MTKPGAPILVFSDWRQLPVVTDAVQAARWEWRGIVVWHKPNAHPMLGSFRHDVEFIIHAAKTPAKPQSRKCFPGGFTHRVVPADKVHLTGKPLPLLVDLLGVAPERGTVLDPFMGGGTTALACIQTGRRFIGVELSNEYFTLTGERIRGAEERQNRGERAG